MISKKMYTQFKKHYAAGIVAVLNTFLIMMLLTACSGQQQQTTATATTGDGVGKLQLPETYFDFGSAQVGQIVIHDFVIQNSGTGILNLTKPDVKLLEGC